jgi:hypothetical protein
LGYNLAGYRELLAVEWDDHAVEIMQELKGSGYHVSTRIVG